MFISVIKKAFVRWWDKMGYSVLLSFVSAVNPFFIFITVYVFLLLMPGGITFDTWQELYPTLYWSALIIPPFMLMAPVFPTSFGALIMQKRVIEHETIYFKKFFKDYGISIWRTLLPSLKLTLIYGIIGFILAFSMVFYFNLTADKTQPAYSDIQNPVSEIVVAEELTDIELSDSAGLDIDEAVTPYKLMPVQVIVLLIHVWLLLILRMSQFTLLPLLVYNDPKLSFGSSDENDSADKDAEKFTIAQGIKLSFKIIFAEGLNVFGIMVLNFFILAVLTLSRALSVVLYYGVSFNLKIFLHKEIVLKYSPPEDGKTPDDREQEFMDGIQATEAWARMLGKIEEKKKEKSENND